MNYNRTIDEFATSPGIILKLDTEFITLDIQENLLNPSYKVRFMNSEEKKKRTPLKKRKM